VRRLNLDDVSLSLTGATARIKTECSSIWGNGIVHCSKGRTMKSPWGDGAKGGGVLFSMLGPSAVGKDGAKRTWLIVDAIQLAGDTALASTNGYE
jgi:hypothetical protein